MPFTVIQSGSTLQFMAEDGTLQNLTLPDGIQLSTTRAPRWVVINRTVILVNTPNAPLAITGDGKVAPLGVAAPADTPDVSVGDPGGLTGTYAGIRYTYIIKDSNGNLVSESAMSPASGSVTLTADNLAVTNIGISPSTATTGRRIYRPTAGGATLFRWLDIDDNTTTSVEDDTPDAALSLIAAPTLGAVPRLQLAKEWKGRIWGADDTDIDTLRFSEPDAWWAWPVTNGINVPIVGGGGRGIIALMPRREYLGIGKRDLIWAIVGDTPQDFRLVKLSELCGVESQESVASYRDTSWWLWKDGVYQWDSEGIQSISDGKVKSWFTTNNYFNRALFSKSFASFDPTTLKYRLFLASAGSNVIDSWVEYDVDTRTWWGPHSSASLNPTSSLIIYNTADEIIPAIGASNAFLWQPRVEATDDVATGIQTRLETGFFHAGEPDFEKYWDHLVVLGKPQEAGTLSITPYVGYTDAAAATPLECDMTLGRQKLGRLGRGQLMKLVFEHTKYNEPIEIYGLEILYNIFGRR